MVASAQGIDVSSFQRPTGNEFVGYDFGFIKATEGTGLADGTFATHWANAKATGVFRGAYHFFHPAEDPVKQAQFFVATVEAQGLEPGDMLVIDSELLAGVTVHPGGANPRFAYSDAPARRQSTLTSIDTLGLTPQQVDNRTLSFLNEVKALLTHPERHPILVYTMHSVGQYLKNTAASYPNLWFAHPSTIAPDLSLIAPWTFWRFWQWGQSGNVDKDAYNGTADDLKTWIETFLPKPKLVVYSWRAWWPTTFEHAATKHNTTPDEIVKAYQKSEAYAKGFRWSRHVSYIARLKLWYKRLPPGVHLFGFKTIDV